MCVALRITYLSFVMPNDMLVDCVFLASHTTEFRAHMVLHVFPTHRHHVIYARTQQTRLRLNERRSPAASNHDDNDSGGSGNGNGNGFRFQAAARTEPYIQRSA